MFCSNCGKEVNDNAVVCLSCGAAVKNVQVGRQAEEGKDWLVTLLLAIFLGYLGIHRFYSGHTLIGIIQLLTAGGCGIWWLIDIILIAAGSYNDAQGNPLVRR